jgi:hypothetical protein
MTCFDILTSSRGALLLHFQSSMDYRDAVRRSPLLFEDVTVEIQHHNQATSHCQADPLVAIFALDFPLLHWFDGLIRHAFQCFGQVLEVD